MSAADPDLLFHLIATNLAAVVVMTMEESATETTALAALPPLLPISTAMYPAKMHRHSRPLWQIP